MISDFHPVPRTAPALRLLGAVAACVLFAAARPPDRPPVTVAVESGAPAVRVGDRTVARLADEAGNLKAGFQLYRDNRNLPIVVSALKGEAEPGLFRYSGSGYAVTDRISPAGDGVFRVERTWRNMTGKEQNIVLLAELARTAPTTFFMIPGISYNGNRRWPRAAFQGLSAAGMSAEEAADSISGAQWVVEGDRPSIPAGTITEAGEAVAGLCADPRDASFSACSLREGPRGMVQCVWWPQQEQPLGLTGTRRAVQAPWETVFLWPGDSVTRAFYIMAAPAVEPRQGYGLILDKAWALFGHPAKVRTAPQKLWELGIRYAKESLWLESPEFTGFRFSLEPKDGGFVPASWPWRFEIGFVGQAGALGALMIEDFLRTKDEDSWKKGKAALDFWARNGRLPNGLVYPRFDDMLAWKTDPDVDTRNMGDAAYFYLLAAELADRAGRPQALWRETGLGICDFFVAHALADGRFGKKWKAGGLVVDPDGTVGAYLLPALIKAHRMTGKPAYRASAEKAFRAYADGDLDAVCLTAGAIDVDTIDKETGYPLLAAGLDLYELTRDPYYLRRAEQAGRYLASWQYHYGIGFPEGSPAAGLGYDAFGGTSVAVGGGGADQGGAVIALGWLRLWKATGNPVWKERAAAAWAHTSTGVSDGSLRLNGKLLPAGAQYEGFQHARTRRVFGNRQGFGTEWLCAWCTAFRLWTLQHWKDWKDLE